MMILPLSAVGYGVLAKAVSGILDSQSQPNFEQALSQAEDLVGKSVKGVDASGTAFAGRIEAIEQGKNGTFLKIEGTWFHTHDAKTITITS